MMSEEPTLYTAPGLINVSNDNPVFHITNGQNENDVLSQAERSGVLRYPRNFFDRIVCGDTEKVEQIMAVEMLTWYLRTVGRC